MALFCTLCLLPCLVVALAFVMGRWLRSIQPWRILPLRGPSSPPTCKTYVDGGAHECLWKRSGPHPCGLNCRLEICRLEEACSAGMVLRPKPAWGRDTLVVRPYPQAG